MIFLLLSWKKPIKHGWATLKITINSATKQVLILNCESATLIELDYKVHSIAYYRVVVVYYQQEITPPRSQSHSPKPLQ